MHLIFIRPNLYKARSADAMQPLAFAILAGLTPPDVKITFFDERKEDIPLDIQADAIVMSVETFTAKRAYEIAGSFRANGIRVIMGGFHPTLATEEALEYADSVVIGDAEPVWPKLLDDLSNGRLKKIYQADSNPVLVGIRYDRRIFQGRRYAPIYPVQFGRGCRYACDFCSISAFYGPHFCQRPVSEVIDEIKMLGAKNIFFVDDNILLETERARELFAALVPLKINWASQVSIDVANDDELLALMQKSGCMNLTIGFESLDQRNLQQMKKAANIKNFNYPELIRKIKSYGIMIYGTFVFGYDFDNKETIDVGVQFALDNRLCLANFNPLTPMPGTKIYERLKGEGRLVHEKWWLNPTFKYGDVVFRPKNMSPGELAEACRQARFTFNKYGNIMRRLFDFQANLQHPGIFLAANLISRKEIHSKQGSLLGNETHFD